MFITGENIDYIIDSTSKINSEYSIGDVELYCKYEGVCLAELIKKIKEDRYKKLRENMCILKNIIDR